MGADPELTTKTLMASMAGDAAATEELIVELQSDLRARAASLLSRESSAHTLQPTALVNEAYLRLIGANQVDWTGRTHFFSAAAEAMWRVLVDHARARKAQKRGGDVQRVTLPGELLDASGADAPLGELCEALEQLEQFNSRHAEIVRLRILVGLTVPDTALALGISESSVEKDWRAARAWLQSVLRRAD